jgi:hypothetical protein
VSTSADVGLAPTLRSFAGAVLQPARSGTTPARAAAARTTAVQMAGSAVTGIRWALRVALDDGDVLVAPGRTAARGAIAHFQGIAADLKRPVGGAAAPGRAPPTGFSRRPRAPMSPYRVRVDVPKSRVGQGWTKPGPTRRIAPEGGQRGLVVTLPRREQISPELALVDPDLAARERFRLPEPGWFVPASTLGSLRLAPPSPVAPPPPQDETVAEAAPPAEPAPPASPAFVFRPRWALEGGMQRVGLDWPLVRPARWDELAREPLFRPTRTIGPFPRPQRRQLVTTAATLLLGMGGASLLWLLAEQTPQPTLQGGLPIAAAPAPRQPTPPAVAPRRPAAPAPPTPTPATPSLVPPVSVPESPAAAPPAASPPAPAAPKPKPVAPKASTPPPAAPVPAAGGTRTLAWAPVTGASGYQVELFRGSRRVLSERTRETRLDVGSSWRHEGKTYSLEPGSYWWYVWPVLKDGTRGGVATVRARLVIGPS